MLPVILFSTTVVFVIAFGKIGKFLYELMFADGELMAPAARSSATTKPEGRKNGHKKPRGAGKTKTIMQVVISIILLSAALVIIFQTSTSPDAQKWAYGMIGTIAGFWLKG
jgi:hypothetical protein